MLIHMKEIPLLVRLHTLPNVFLYFNKKIPVDGRFWFGEIKIERKNPKVVIFNLVRLCGNPGLFLRNENR